jgi:RNA-binding protein Luc7-like 2
MSFEDRRVCRPFLLNCCPHEILSGTRVDLGECTKIHEYALRADYERAATTRDLGYELDALDMLNKFVAECDRKTENAKRKLHETQEELGEEAARKMNSIHELGEQIGTKLAKAEELGAQGLVDESMKLLEEVEELRKAKSDAEQEFRSTMPASTYQQQKLRVCEVCSAYLGIHDNDRRLADHFGGKLHLGFIQIREKLADLKKRVTELNEKRELERKNRRNSPPTSSSSSSSRNDRRGGDDRDRGDYRSSHRGHSPSKKIVSKDRRGSRSTDHRSSKHSRSHRSRSRSNGRRHSKRSRSRSGSSRRHRRSRSHSGTSSSRHHHHHHRHDSRSPVHSSSNSKQNGSSDSRRKDKSNDNIPPNHSTNDDDEETTRILESIQRSMNEDQDKSHIPMK